MSSIQPSSGSNYNPFRTENDRPTSNAPITGMGKLSGDYGKSNNWFFRKVYDSVSALFSGKYWKGGWFAPKQSGSSSESFEGRISSVSSDVDQSLNSSSNSVLSSVNSAENSGFPPNGSASVCPNNQLKIHSFKTPDLDTVPKLGAQENQKRMPQINGVTTEETQPVLSASNAYRGDNKVNLYTVSDSDVAAKSESHTRQNVLEKYTEFKNAQEHYNDSEVMNSKDLRKVFQTKLKTAEEAYQNALKGLEPFGLEFNPETKTFSKKK